MASHDAAVTRQAPSVKPMLPITLGGMAKFNNPAGQSFAGSLGRNMTKLTHGIQPGIAFYETPSRTQEALVMVTRAGPYSPSGQILGNQEPTSVVGEGYCQTARYLVFACTRSAKGLTVLVVLANGTGYRQRRCWLTRRGPPSDDDA